MGILYQNHTYTGKPASRFAAPQAIWYEIFKFLHTGRLGGHLSIQCSATSAHGWVWWPEMKRDVVWCIQHYDMCEYCTARQGSGQDPLCQKNLGTPVKRIMFDIISFLQPTKDGNTFFLAICHFSWSGPKLSPWLTIKAKNDVMMKDHRTEI